ncbi:MAG: hypothetical protein K8T26_00615 [Lentisphaerae bacterium]|nr:hypothetical protein [Lentisphaerota bacterium]
MYTKQHYRRRGFFNKVVSGFWSLVSLALTIVVIYWLVRMGAAWLREMNTAIEP